MQVFDEVTKSWMNARKCVRIVLQNFSSLTIYGYTSKPERVVYMFTREDYAETKLVDPKLYKGVLLFSKRRGMYFSPAGLDNESIDKELHIKGSGGFPYLLERKYEAVENFSKFKNKQVLDDPTRCHKLADHLKYTFGVEFETSQGFIPEDVCYRDGLIPLRDGSISGPEYSTVVLKGNAGISLLYQQLEALREYTDFNKECSLHIHLGGYPLDPVKMYNLYCVCKCMEEYIQEIVPPLTFQTSSYKANGKDYCKKLPRFTSFEHMYKSLVGRPFFGSFFQAHPNDVDRKHKWNVITRYYWCNFINALCYNVNKTIEFRFLRPTYNFKKIILWLYILNGMLKYAEEHFTKDNFPVSLEYIMYTCYPKELADEIVKGIRRLWMVKVNQVNNEDDIGMKVWMEDHMFYDLNI